MLLIILLEIEKYVPKSHQKVYYSAYKGDMRIEYEQRGEDSASSKEDRDTPEQSAAKEIEIHSDDESKDSSDQHQARDLKTPTKTAWGDATRLVLHKKDRESVGHENTSANTTIETCESNRSKHTADLESENHHDRLTFEEEVPQSNKRETNSERSPDNDKGSDAEEEALSGNIHHEEVDKTSEPTTERTPSHISNDDATKACISHSQDASLQNKSIESDEELTVEHLTNLDKRISDSIHSVSSKLRLRHDRSNC